MVELGLHEATMDRQYRTLVNGWGNKGSDTRWSHHITTHAQSHVIVTKRRVWLRNIREKNRVSRMERSIGFGVKDHGCMLRKHIKNVVELFRILAQVLDSDPGVWQQVALGGANEHKWQYVLYIVAERVGIDVSRADLRHDHGILV